MLRYGNPFLGRYLRYVVTLLILGILLPVILFPQQPAAAVVSILAAVLLTAGLDAVIYFAAKNKAAAFTKEDVRVMIPALKTKADWRGYLIMTDSYILFVPIFHKITFVSEWRKVVSYDMEGGYIELLISHAAYKRSVHFIVAYPNMAREELDKRTKEARIAVEV
ncbi:hypothetical protein [Alkalicoccus halolimnae]|uniref:Uncharacterized protein n=1 Tax=Alkalicoccus halolimnae TaxID=1667239 RepID=A0A5C7FBP9_9BACI|nr:hypothetical protein [Alkalicoccus halolimnae]TXF86878.1 hypothetical protein FTX54_02850 [Alkalicoccus halolimnae]